MQILETVERKNTHNFPKVSSSEGGSLPAVGEDLLVITGRKKIRTGENWWGKKRTAVLFIFMSKLEQKIAYIQCLIATEKVSVVLYRYITISVSVKENHN